MNVLVFDLEVRKSPEEIGWKNYSEMGISIGCAFIGSCREWRFYDENNIHRLLEDMKECDLIVGFNILEFDMPLLRATVERVLGSAVLDAFWETLLAKCYDLLGDIRGSLGTKIARGWNLDNVARSNLPFSKNGHGTDAPTLWQEGRYAELATYVAQDVKVESALFFYALIHGEIKNDFAPGGPTVLRLQLIAGVLERIGGAG